MKNTTHRTEMLRANSLEVRVAARGGRRIAQPVLALVGQPWSASSFATWEKGVPGRSTGLSSERSGPVCTRRGRREYPTCSLTLILHRRCGFAKSKKRRQMHYLNKAPRSRTGRRAFSCGKRREMHYLNKACEYSRHQNPGRVEEKSRCTT